MVKRQMRRDAAVSAEVYAGGQLWDQFRLRGLCRQFNGTGNGRGVEHHAPDPV